MAKKTITITSALDNNDVALWEKHPDHPEEEIFVAGEVEVEAAETPQVLKRIAEGWLVKVEAKKSGSSSSSSKK